MKFGKKEAFLRVSVLGGGGGGGGS
jgi:hypothetical protein